MLCKHILTAHNLVAPHILSQVCARYNFTSFVSAGLRQCYLNFSARKFAKVVYLLLLNIALDSTSGYLAS